MIRNFITIFITWIVTFQSYSVAEDEYHWLSTQNLKRMVEEFKTLELNRTVMHDKLTNQDRRSSSPFITGDGFRTHCYPFICDEDNLDTLVPPIHGKHCNFTTSGITDGSCIFVRAGMLEYFVRHKLPNIHASIKIYTDHHGDQANPDGQNIVGLKSKKWVLSKELQKYHESGVLIALHSVNLHWKGFETNVPRPVWAHCVPIGLENRDATFGAQIHKYIEFIEKYSINHQNNSIERPLLLLSFDYKPLIKPDRRQAYVELKRIGWNFNSTSNLPWEEWMLAIARHKFTLAPHGHGLDTHRMMEILLMGGIPVIKRSSITSCYDDSDNVMSVHNMFHSGSTSNPFMTYPNLTLHNHRNHSNHSKVNRSRRRLNALPIVDHQLTRGSLPIVVVEHWYQVTEERLHLEWRRIISHPPEYWDWKRLFIHHWIERLDFPTLD